MTIYAGEELKVVLSAKDFDHTRTLTDSDVQRVDVHGFNAAGVEILTAQLSWDAANQSWFHLWDTVGLPAGTYKLKLVVTALDGSKSWEWRRTRLARDPLPA